ncbi:MAG: hypothetical protein HYV09_39215 [Deltaproteobacteria bacterium]|nr:hypothetical protein [Deltaproteobacteria bacterium]
MRIPEWEPPEELDIRELDDGVLLFLDVPFDSDQDELLDAVEAAIGDFLYEQDDDRGVFFFPDATEPEGVETYDGVIAAVAEAGKWASLDAPAGVTPEALLGNADALMGQLFEAMGAGSADDIVRAMRDGDQDALKLAQIRMAGALERAVQAPAEDEEPEKPKK